MNILVIAPHPDDESIGCGGTLCLHVDRGDRVTAVFLTSGELGLPDLPEPEARCVRETEAKNAATILGLASLTFLRRPDGHLAEDTGAAAEELRLILDRERPGIIYLPHESDWHPDHRASIPIVQEALRGSGIPAPSLLSYEVLTPLAEYDCAEDISAVMRRKLKAVRAHGSQVERLRYDRAARALNEYRGAIAEMGRYAEVFRLAGAEGFPPARRGNPCWYRIYQTAERIKQIIPAEDSFLLVDEGRLEGALMVAPRRYVPFPEKEGHYWGRPEDEASAIRELERTRESGVGFLVFIWSTFWWLDYYSGFRQYVDRNFPCVHRDERLIVFDLKARGLSGPVRQVA